MKIVSLAEARDAGLPRYFTGVPCKRGHVAERFTCDKHCSECNALKRADPENKERQREAYREWCKANPERAKELQAKHKGKYKDTDKEARRARFRKWAKSNPEKVKEFRRNRRAQEKLADGKHTAADVASIYERQNGRCACCNKKVGADYHVDHIIALSRGGSNWPSNLQVLCPTCNGRKGAKCPIQFAQENGRLL